MLSPSAKRRRLRESPLLEPLAQRSPPRRARPEPASSPPRKPAPPALSPETRRRWMLEALAALDASTLSLALRRELVESPQHRRARDLSAPSLLSSDLKALAVLMGNNDDSWHGQSSTPSPKNPPTCDPVYASLPLYARRDVQRSPTKPPHHLPSATSVNSLRISHEMLTKLQAHLADKIHGDQWHNELRSRLARPLSASVFSTREEQLRHPLAATQFRPEDPAGSQRPLYPYSLEAHAWSARIGRMYRKHVYRRELLAALRRLACAIRFFRRVIIPRLVRAHRRRRRAAVVIQRRLRRYQRWKRHVLRPFVERFVAQVTALACARVCAGVVLATKLKRLVRARRAREAHARERRRVVFRWVAKTRVALFVHKIWCVRWFRGKRTRNVARLHDELAQLEASDAAVHREYSTIFGTGFGRALLKKELATWRRGIQKPKTQANPPETGGDAVLVRLRQCFQVFDLDGSGALDLDEFELMLAHLRATIAKHPTSATDMTRAKLTTAQVRDLFASLDRDGDGSVSCREIEAWWSARRGDEKGQSGSASVSLLAAGLDRFVLTGHGMLLWLLGKQQQLEFKFVKKRLVRRAQQSAKRALLESWRQDEAAAGPQGDETRRCSGCGRRFGLTRDLHDHSAHACRAAAGAWVLDAFLWKRWLREEELRLLEDEDDGAEEESEDEEEDTKSASELATPAPEATVE